MARTKRKHALLYAGRDIHGEGYCASLCGLNEESAADWDAAQTVPQVTCLRCLKALPGLDLTKAGRGWPFKRESADVFPSDDANQPLDGAAGLIPPKGFQEHVAAC